MAEMINKWEVVSKLITLQNNYGFFKNEWDAERLYREIAKLEIEIGKTSGVELVFCKDCKMEPYCKVAQHLGEDGFCSYGERISNHG